ncbi:hypothetical protein T484DRAFT_1796032 [Baffinella frigidus]|nr:hypothetical protein T484DRAFT_1796032 [Cryptophyta sp. CCMP2293]
MAATNATKYDDIAEQYQASKKIDWREFVEFHTLRQVLAKMHPELTGLSILNLACGEEIYSRAMKRLEASEVLGVDISREMVALAEANEADEPLPTGGGHLGP